MKPPQHITGGSGVVPLQGGPGSQPSLAGRRFVPDRLVVRFDPQTPEATRRQIRGALGAALLRRLPLPGAEVLALPRGMSVAAARSRLAGHPAVLYSEPDFILRTSAVTPNDPRYRDLWALGGSTAAIGAPLAWDLGTGTSSTVVAVVDTGVAYDHPDLARNMWVNPGESGSGRETNGKDDDANGYVDDWRGWDFAANSNDPADTMGHGTHVAGTIGAVGGNQTGVTGVSWSTRIMPLRALDATGSGTSSAIAAAFDYAADMGADVVNASLGGAGRSQTIEQAIAAHPETLFVVAAGNEAANNDTTPATPCNAPGDNVICVAASTKEDSLATYSNYGATSVDLAAPGSGILSAMPPIAGMFFAGFEGELGTRWTSGGTNNSWGRSSGSYGYFLADSPAGSYAPNTDAWIRTTDAISLAGTRGCRLHFLMNLDTESGADGLIIQGSTDGSSWTRIASYSGTTRGGWAAMAEDISAYDGRNLYLRMRLTSDSNATTGAGADIDDIEVACLRTTYSSEDYGYASGTSMATPHVTGAAALLVSQRPTASVNEIRAALLGAAAPRPALSGKTVTGGRLDLYQAMLLLTGTAPVEGGATPGPTTPSTPAPAASPTPAAAADEVARVVRVRMRGHLVVEGTVRAGGLSGCTARVPVVLKRRGTVISRGRTDATGAFALRVRDRLGRYEVVLPTRLAASGTKCLRARSVPWAHAHRSSAPDSYRITATDSFSAESTTSGCWQHQPSEFQLVERINQERAGRATPELRLDPELSRVARANAREMVRSGVVAHTHADVLAESVTNWTALAENVGVGDAPAPLHAAFMGSTEHTENILSPDFHHIGIGAVESEGRIWVTIIFASESDPGTTLPMPSC